ncbi:protein trichome birefringence-like 19 [Coffea eugenioides]|uniref:Protein trichome birefringence-like 19 n=1 Tax=Coffea arabica TaxID=13443 RepID=A0A6P6TWF8_COFAR|nr:protein trichome birefringence-like 19 [Coffea arabica]XP_027155840.1 protein trichome birefringence-like 19 [Coffea eugenioides]XP_027157425.1 protein trichome birefringence-like 19 [Coffea eugenioides]
MELPLFMNRKVEKIPIILLLLTALILLAIVKPDCPLPIYEFMSRTSAVSQPPERAEVKFTKMAIYNEKCDIFTGKWIPNPKAPYYTNSTCWAIHEYQNCMKYGRPDDEFMKWRWKPDACELPIFNPNEFLDIVKGKSMAFLGDSLGRNHMQSLICLLSKVETPIDASYVEDDHFRRWNYTSRNFTLAALWSPFLVKSGKANTGPDHYNLYLDEVDWNWASKIEEFDYVILNSGNWFYRPSFYYENHQFVGCSSCQMDNVTDLSMTYGYRKALKTAFGTLKSLKNYKGITFLRTFPPSHYENGNWNAGGNCLRKVPYMKNEISLEGTPLEIYLTQVEEFKAAEKEWEEKGLRFKLFDTTQAMLLRPDGHPSKYGHWPKENVTLYNDCVHWCLPGPIDSWNDFLLHMLKMEGKESYLEMLEKIGGKFVLE